MRGFGAASAGADTKYRDALTRIIIQVITTSIKNSTKYIII